jgi:hypothetical protein
VEFAEQPAAARLADGGQALRHHLRLAVRARRVPIHHTHITTSDALPKTLLCFNIFILNSYIHTTYALFPNGVEKTTRFAKIA